MKRVLVVQPGPPLRGRIRVPGDKSLSHRALLLGAMADGPCRVTGLLDAEDVHSTAGAVQGLGASLERDGDAWLVRPPAELTEPPDVIDCGNAGTAIRLLTGVCAALPHLTILTGDGSLRSRPMMRVVKPLRKMGAEIDGRDGGKLAPLVIRGGGLSMHQHDLPVASAQVKSALLLAGLRSGVAVREPRQSRDHTERLLGAMGVSLRRAADGWLMLVPGQRLRAIDHDVPGDISSAAFLLVAASLIEGSEITLESVGVNPTRTGVLDALIEMGADITVERLPTEGPEPRANITVRSARLRGIRIDGDLALRCLDELPVLSVAAAYAEGETVIADAAELRVKESDRIACTADGLRQLGAEVEERPDGMVIGGGRPLGPASVEAEGDHRVAMAFAVAGLVAPRGVRIKGAQSIRTSYPNFFEHIDQLARGEA